MHALCPIVALSPYSPCLIYPESTQCFVPFWKELEIRVTLVTCKGSQNPLQEAHRAVASDYFDVIMTTSPYRDGPTAISSPNFPCRRTYLHLLVGMMTRILHFSVNMLCQRMPEIGNHPIFTLLHIKGQEPIHPECQEQVPCRPHN
jgi:hypothetical protein